MTGQEPRDAGVRFDFYGAQYSRFAGDLARAMRRAVYGADLGQQGWRDAEDEAAIAELVAAGPPGPVLDVACGSGGPSLALAERTGCQVTGIDIEAAAIAYATAQAAARGLNGRVAFVTMDCRARLPFADGAFAALLCIDAINHLPDRFATLAEWARLLRPGGRLLFIDPIVLTGALSKEEFDIRASLGFYLVVPPALNEQAIAAAGLSLLRRADRTAAGAAIAARWHDVRAGHAEALAREEGAEFFSRRQRFLATTAELAASGRLSRFLYVAEKTA